jgi:hypothetical protein
MSSLVSCLRTENVVEIETDSTTRNCAKQKQNEGFLMYESSAMSQANRPSIGASHRSIPHRFLHRMAVAGWGAIFCVTLQVLSTPAPAAEPATRPNIVLIMADDNSQ